MDKNSLPAEYVPHEVEARWGNVWKQEGIYNYNPEKPKEETYVVDTPPPTVSGALHMGHVFSYTQTDVIVRYQRMCGKNIFYPMGWDDNGLPTERRVQNVFGISCEPTLPYDPLWKPTVRHRKPGDFEKVSRKNFLEACNLQTKEDEKKYELLWRRLGLSVDWSLNYSTIGEHCRKISQISFLDLWKKGLVYSLQSPTLWDIDFKTAIAQAEVEDRQVAGNFYDVKFKTVDGEEFIISTTRPELLPACIAVVAHPEDVRYKHLFGKFAITPLFNIIVPIIPAAYADPEKGTGIMMVCTFGDIADVEFYKNQHLPLRQIIGRDGRLLPINFYEEPFKSRCPEKAANYYKQIEGNRVKQAKLEIVKILSAAGLLVGEPKPTIQAVKFYEKGDSPLEFIPTRQWYIKIVEHKSVLLEMGSKVKWHPPYMFKRYEQWVNGLNQDWCISRQRFFGVPFPVWYPLDGDGNPDFTRPILAQRERLPVDPQIDSPSGMIESQRGKPYGFIGDMDVMDTWATSSLTPLISSGWMLDAERHKKLFPADLRPQGHEIIRTWAFYTIAKSWMHESIPPWKHIAISGWVVNPERQKMSKSKEGGVTPQSLLDRYSADALRYWSARVKLGQDTVYDESVFKVGKRLCTKIFNASKFVMLQIFNGEKAGTSWSMSDITEPLDRSLVSRICSLINACSIDFNNYDYMAVLLRLESEFWNFCDNYLELVKARAYNIENCKKHKSALATLEWTMSVFLRLFAPFLPYITEETWSWYFAGKTGYRSIHISNWPSEREANVVSKEKVDFLKMATEVISKIRNEKSTQKKSIKWPVKKLIIESTPQEISYLEQIIEDIMAAGNISQNCVELKPCVTCRVETVMNITVELADTSCV